MECGGHAEQGEVAVLVGHLPRSRPGFELTDPRARRAPKRPPVSAGVRPAKFLGIPAGYPASGPLRWHPYRYGDVSAPVAAGRCGACPTRSAARTPAARRVGDRRWWCRWRCSGRGRTRPATTWPGRRTARPTTTWVPNRPAAGSATARRRPACPAHLTPPAPTGCRPAGRPVGRRAAPGPGAEPHRPPRPAARQAAGRCDPAPGRAAGGAAFGAVPAGPGPRQVRGARGSGGPVAAGPAANGVPSTCRRRFGV